MNRALDLLIVDDSLDDAELLVHALRRLGFDPQWERVEEAPQMSAALARQRWDLILCDHAMPRFSSASALRLLQDARLEIPFIVVSGTIGEEAAVAAMRAGAQDYVLKNSLARLGPAIERELRDFQSRREGGEALKASEERFALALAGADLGFWDWDIANNRVRVNQRAWHILGYQRADTELPVQDWIDMMHPEDWTELGGLIRNHFRGNSEAVQVALRVRAASGDWRWLLARGKVLDWNEDGRAMRAAGTYLDISSQKQAEDDLRLAARVLESTAEGILITDDQGRIISVNRAFCELTGFQREEVLGELPGMLDSGRHDPGFYEQVHKLVAERGQWTGEVWNSTKAGEVKPYFMTVTALKDQRGGILNYVRVLRDISAIKESQEQLEYLANYDALTGLPNRNLFYERLKVGMEKAGRRQTGLAVMFLDLDNFKVVNDTLGHDVGDELLIEVASRLKECVRQEDMVCRQGGDEFTVFVEDVPDPQTLASTAQRLVHCIAEPYHLSGHEFFVTGSVGISVFPSDGETISELVKNADTAMYKVKEQGKNGFQFFREDMNARAFERLFYVSGLRHAMEREEFHVAYQPQIDLTSGQLMGAECLLRWRHPERGPISPKDFIPVAEETGLIVAIGEWVFERVCRQLQAWGPTMPEGMRLSVNVSARQFRQKNLAEMIGQTLDSHGVAPHCLAVELTESALMEEPDSASRLLHSLKDMGLAIHIDDFGTGYSSLAYLKRFPIDGLKVDQAFVRDIATDPDDAAIVTAIITMARALNLHVIAEGVETEEQLAFLRAHGCHAAQGYHFSRPLPAENMAEYFTEPALRS